MINEIKKKYAAMRTIDEKTSYLRGLNAPGRLAPRQEGKSELSRWITREWNKLKKRRAA